jgi:hypothetical protein
MGVKSALKAFILLLSLFLLFGCGDLMLFPSKGSYQIKATVNGYSLEECSLIRAEDQIRPYFAVSVAEDPDLTALLVYLRNAQGVQAGEKVRYVIGIGSFWEDEEPPEPIGEEEETPPDEEGEDVPPDTSVTESPELPELPESIEQLAPREAWSFADNQTTRENTDIVIEVASFDKDLPYFPLPENLEPGAYTLVFEAVGGKNILSRTESEIFYLGNIEFYLKDISMYLPGVSSSRIISPGAMIMLEAGLDYDSRLDPYVIWYNGKNIISEGRIKDGKGNILRKMPDQTGFYSIRREVHPFPLKPGFTGYSREVTLTISPKAANTGYFFTDGPQFAAYHSLAQGTAFPEQVKLSAAAELNISTANTPVPPRLLHLYQFGGSMHDSVFPLQAESELTPVSDTPQKWVAVGQSFGLSTGPSDSYLLPPFYFFRENPEQGGGIFLLHIKPAEGIIFKSFFPFRASPVDGVTMEMTATENSVLLRLSTAGESDTELSLYPSPSARRTYIPVAVEFFFRPYRLEARMSMGEPPFNQSVTGILKLPNTVAGEGRIRLGGDSGAVGTVSDATRPANPEIEKSPPPENASPDSTAFFQDEIFAENLFPEMTGEIPESKEETEPAPATDTATPYTGPTEPRFPSTIPEFPVGTGKKVISSSSSSSAVTVWNEFAVLYSRSVLLPEEDLITAESENTKQPEKESVPNIPAVTVTPIQNPQTEPEETPIAADQDESDSEILTSLEEEPPADHQEDFPLLDTEEKESPGDEDEDEESTEDHSVAVSKDL